MWCRLIGRFYPAFQTSIWTTVGETIYHPHTELGAKVPYQVLEHEKVHVAQYRRLSVPLFLFLYLLMPLPIGLAYFRWRLEREAYLLEINEHGRGIEDVVQTLWHGYGWPWPRRWMRAWFVRHAKRG